MPILHLAAKTLGSDILGYLLSRSKNYDLSHFRILVDHLFHFILYICFQNIPLFLRHPPSLKTQVIIFMYFDCKSSHLIKIITLLNQFLSILDSFSILKDIIIKIIIFLFTSFLSFFINKSIFLNLLFIRFTIWFIFFY